MEEQPRSLPEEPSDQYFYPSWFRLRHPYNIMVYTPNERDVLRALPSHYRFGPFWSTQGYATRHLVYDGWARSPGELFIYTGIERPPVPWEEEVLFVMSGAMIPVPFTERFYEHQVTSRRFISAESLAEYTAQYAAKDETGFWAGHGRRGGPLKPLRLPPPERLVPHEDVWLFMPFEPHGSRQEG